MEFLDTAVEFIKYVFENWGVVVWTIVAYALVAYSRELKNQYLQGKIDTEFEEIVYRLVLAAEEYLVDGDDKYGWVANSIKNMAPDLSDEDIKFWIDSTVRMMKAENMEKPKDAPIIPDNSNEGV